jgi:glutamine synthetase
MATQVIVNQREIDRLDQEKVSQFFGCSTFNERTARERLPKDLFKAYKECLSKGMPLTPEVAQGVALAMKDWAMEKGVTHYTHWFIPLTGATAEKHDAFIAWDEPGTVIERFSGGQLAQGEPDASSFPSGGLRATFEARGYTMWDPASPAFIKKGPRGSTLCIPTAFIGYHGEALDHKLPLLRSIEVVNKYALKALSFFGSQASRVTAQCGPEQEYFLVDLGLARQRPDLMFANRTLQGARAPKGQELEDHYFGSIKERVLSFMQEVELEAFKLGIPAKTRHNEVAPNQFEIAPIYEPAALASDHNQMLMELMKSVAERHGLMALLHEKPFSGINGSGKHVNWSLATNQGQNLLEPGHTPQENLQFLYFLVACLKALHRHGALLRACIASAANDHRLGANEAPPAIMSAYLGRQLNHVLDAIESENVADAEGKKLVEIELANLPRVERDATDRNRTSPFAFTGNKFEFRAVGSSQPIAWPLTVINAAVAESLDDLNQQVDSELAAGASHDVAVLGIIRKAIIETKSIRFEGNNYAEEWKAEAEKRGLPHAKDTVEALRTFEEKKAQDVFTRPGILSAEEVESRTHICHEQYQKAISIEAQLLREIAETLILPAVLEDLRRRSEALNQLTQAGVEVAPSLRHALKAQAQLAGIAQERLGALRSVMLNANEIEDLRVRTAVFGGSVRAAQEALRESLDQLEKNAAAELWPVPVYRELLAPLV